MGLLDILRGVADQADFIPGFDPVQDKRGLLSQLLSGREQYGQTPPIVQPGTVRPANAVQKNPPMMAAPGGANPYAEFAKPRGILKRMITPNSLDRQYDAKHMSFLEHRDMAAKAKQAAAAATAQREQRLKQGREFGLSGRDLLSYAASGEVPEHQIFKQGDSVLRDDGSFNQAPSLNESQKNALGQLVSFDPNTGLFSDPTGPAKLETVSDGSVVIDPVTRQPVFENPKDKSGPGVVVNTGQPSKDNLTPFQLEQDKIYAQILAEWNTGGGADAVKQLGQLTQVADALESGRDDLTGFLIGITPKWALEGLNPEAVNARELVEEVVQRNLRIVLGAQFTEKEGERLIARAYNPSLPENVNADRLRRLVASVEARAQQIESLNEFVNRNGTTAGWDGSLLTVDQILSDIEGSGRSGGKPMAGQKRKVYNSATGEFE